MKMQKGPFDFQISSFLKLIILIATGLISSDKVSFGTFLSITGFFLEVIWCVFDLYFLRPIDGKFCSAIESPVNNWKIFIFYRICYILGKLFIQ